MALHENPLVFVKWSMRGNLVLKCAKPMDDLIKEGIKEAVANFFPSPLAEVMILNKPPTTALKFLAVPRHNLDGSDTDEMDLLNDLTAHPVWAAVELWSNPKFINLKSGMAGATVVVSVIDDNQGNVGRQLMGTMVDFSGCTWPCKRWVELPTQPFCAQCQSWGHPGACCPANVLICARCGGTHDFRQHDRYCKTCKKGPGHSCTPFCPVTPAPLSVVTAMANTCRPPTSAHFGLAAPARNGTPSYTLRLKPNSHEETQRIPMHWSLRKLLDAKKSVFPALMLTVSSKLAEHQV